ncbi:hypothetical protein V493_01896 [Pseudogymnoascus sp. VKM F-4281 (FW-2241)]|nr:hypothetical protein V493_01896 [Pseudogymnoascus sp. VKM F-4281 (FW-2241)]
MSFLEVTSPVLHLGSIALFSPLVFAYAIAFIDPSYTLQRASILFLSVAIAAQLQYSVPVFTGNSTYDGIFMSLVWIFHLRAFDLILWKAVYLSLVKARKPKPLRSSATRSGLWRIYTAWCLLFNLRNINTPWSVKGLPDFSRGRPEHIPNKSEFLKRRTAHILITYLALDAIFAFLPAPNPGIDVPEYKQSLFSRIRDVTLEEIIARPFTAILPAFSIYGIFIIPYNIASITAVLFGSEPQNWPPLFGSFLDAYTMRRFWGITWHQLLRSSLEAFTSFFATRILCISPHWRILSRFVRLFLAFYVTALIHLPGTVILGESPFATDVPKFFLMQAVGIMIESTVIYVWAATGRAAAGNVTAMRMAKLLGFIWVLAWTTWTGPGYTWVVARKLVRFTGPYDLISLRYQTQRSRLDRADIDRGCREPQGEATSREASYWRGYEWRGYERLERGHELEEAAKKGLRKLGGKPTGLESGRTIKWESHKLEVAMESGERPSWESCKPRKLQTGKAPSWADHKAAGPEVLNAWKDLQQAWIGISKIAICGDRDEMPLKRKQNLLADDMVFVKKRYFPLRDPTLAASVTQNSDASTPPCEDGVDPFTTTASAANDETATNDD